MSRKVDLALVAGYTMPSGVGNLETHQACVVAQAAILDKMSRGEPVTEITDTLECACPVLRVLAIALNDIAWWDSDKERQTVLGPLRLLLLDSRRDPSITVQRAAKAAVFAKSAAKYAKSAAESPESAKSAESAAKYLRPLRGELLRVWLECEAMQ